MWFHSKMFPLSHKYCDVEISTGVLPISQSHRESGKRTPIHEVIRLKLYNLNLIGECHEFIKGQNYTNGPLIRRIGHGEIGRILR